LQFCSPAAAYITTAEICLLVARWSIALWAATVSLAFAGPVWAGTCHAATYAYAGLGSRSAVRGVAATIAPTAASRVRDGHVAGWVGVGGYGVGPNGTDEWIQIGFIAFPNSATEIYYEVTSPGSQPVQTIVDPTVPVGERHRIAVLELARRPNWWRVWLDGRPVSGPILLPRSHGRLTAQVTGESYNGLSEGSCNLYSFAFQDVALADARGRVWSAPRRFDRFQDPNYLFERRSATSFVARSSTPIA
jgi:hypothetical protein